MDKKDVLKNGVLWGAIWGLIESTLGFVLHLLPSGISGKIMFPIATVLIMYAYEKTKSVEVTTVMAFVASFIKLTNLLIVIFFIPSFTPIMLVKVVNPAIAILIEGLVVTVGIRYTLHENKEMKLWAVPVMTFGYLLAFRLIQFGLYSSGVPMGKAFENGFDFVNMIIVSGVYTSVIGIIFVLAYKFVPKKGKVFNVAYAYSFGALAIAIVVNSVAYLVQ